MKSIPIVVTCALGCLIACGNTPADGTDAATNDAIPADADPLADAGRSFDADPNLCEPDRLWNVVADRAVIVGDYCDDIQVCVGSAEAAVAVMAIEPGFLCSDPPGQAGCTVGERFCQWPDPDVLDTDDYAELCAITGLEDVRGQLTCMLHL